MNVVFDFAGVLFHWQPQALLARLLPHRVRTPAEARHWVDAIFEAYGGDWAEFDRGTLAPDALAQCISARTGLAVGEALAVIDAVARELQPVPEMVTLLNRLDEHGVPLFFLSNMPAPYASALEQHGFMRLFRQGVFSARVGWIKPEPQIFALAAERFGIEPARTLFIDDVDANVQAARAAGWHALLHHDAGRCESELIRRGLLPATAESLK